MWISHARCGDQCHQNHDKLNQKKHWDDMMQGTHTDLSPVGLDAYNFPFVPASIDVRMCYRRGAEFHECFFISGGGMLRGEAVR